MSFVVASQNTLSEADSKLLISPFGIPFAQERICVNSDEAVGAANEIGYPVVVKVSGDHIATKLNVGWSNSIWLIQSK